MMIISALWRTLVLYGTRYFVCVECLIGKQKKPILKEVGYGTRLGGIWISKNLVWNWNSLSRSGQQKHAPIVHHTAFTQARTGDLSRVRRTD